MDVNMTKTFAIPLWGQTVEEAQTTMKNPIYKELPRWTWATKG